MDYRRKILLVDGEQQDIDYISAKLRSCDFDVITATTGKGGREMAESHCPDMVLLGLTLPDVDGLKVLREIREWSDMPVIALSEDSDEIATVEALDSGADDFIPKTVGIRELISRIKAAFRHSAGTGREDVRRRYTVGSLEIDYDKYRAFIAGKDAELTQNEFKIVALLGKYAGKVLTYEYIITQLWGPNARGDNQILRVNIANIRRKIEENTAKPRYIFTEAGIGYRMADK